MIFLVQFGINKHLSIFSKTNKIAQARRASAICGLWKNINAYLFQIALEIMWLPILKCNVNCARSYLWRRLRALYLNSAIVWRKALALWKYNEFVLTNHGARISLNFLETLVEHALSTNDSVRYVRTLLQSLLSVFIIGAWIKLSWLLFYRLSIKLCFLRAKTISYNNFAVRVYYYFSIKLIYTSVWMPSCLNN